MGAAPEDAARVDGGLVWDGAVPEAAAVLFAEVDLGGASRLVTSDLTTLGNLTNDAASLVVAEGYTLYGAALDDYGGDLTDPYVGPITVNDLGVLADQWESVIFRPSTEPVATVYRTIPLMVEAGIVKQTMLSSGESHRYEASFEREHHDHLVCLDCGKVEEFYDAEIEKRQKSVAKAKGFTIADHALSLYANCTKEKCPNRTSLVRTQDKQTV